MKGRAGEPLDGETPSKFEEFATRLGKLVASKNAQYGNSVETSAKCLQILYPNGVSVGQMRDMLMAARILDKLSRIANGARVDSYADIGGYGICGAVLEESCE